MAKILLHSRNIFMLFIHVSCSRDSETMWLYLLSNWWTTFWFEKTFKISTPFIWALRICSWVEHHSWQWIFIERNFDFLSRWLSTSIYILIWLGKKRVKIFFDSFECYWSNFNNSLLWSFFGRKCNHPIAIFIWFYA